MIIPDQNGGNGKVSAAASLVGEWCGIPASGDGPLWIAHYLNRRVVGMEGGARVGFRFKGGDVHSRTAASLRGPVEDKGFRWHKGEKNPPIVPPSQSPGSPTTCGPAVPYSHRAPRRMPR